MSGAQPAGVSAQAVVVDASLVAAAFFPEEHTHSARSLLAGDSLLLVPDLLFSEVGNVIWKRWRRGEINDQEAGDLANDLRRLPFQVVGSSLLVEDALLLAIRSGRTVYDSMYLALAVREQAVLWTADERFANALADTPLEQHIHWIGLGAE
jgi:predicted nucleic acid-binding protein